MNTENTCSHSNLELLADIASSMSTVESDGAFREASNSSKSSDNCFKAAEPVSDMCSDSIAVTDVNMRENICNADDGIHDSGNNIIGNSKGSQMSFNEQNILKTCRIETDFSDPKNDTEYEDAEFTDAVQFFKDSLDFKSDGAFREAPNSSKSSENCFKAAESVSDMCSDSISVTDVNMREDICNTDDNIHDSGNNITGNSEKSQLSFNEQNIPKICCIGSDFSDPKNDTECEDAEFIDAVQFFKDSSDFDFLEKAGTSKNPSESLMSRTSLYQKFDPLYTKFFSESNSKPKEVEEIKNDNVTNLDNFASVLSSSNTQNELDTINRQKDTNAILLNETSDKLESDASHNINKDSTNESLPESLENALISFDSLICSEDTFSLSEIENIGDCKKTQSNANMKQCLKIEELEDAALSVLPKSSMRRSSLYRMFDPLHEKTFSQHNMETNEMHEITELEVQTELDELRNASAQLNEVESHAIQNSTNALLEVASVKFKNMVNSQLSIESLRSCPENELISLPSSIIIEDVDSHAENKSNCSFLRKYIEEHVQQDPEIRELTMNENNKSEICSFANVEFSEDAPKVKDSDTEAENEKVHDLKIVYYGKDSTGSCS